MNAEEFKKLLGLIGVSFRHIQWGEGRDALSFWENCLQADWLLHVAAKVGVDRRLVVLAACDCAETALEYVPPEDKRPAEAIRIARAWCDGKATPAEVSIAYSTACDAADDYSAAAGTYNDYAAAHAAADPYVGYYYDDCAAKADNENYAAYSALCAVNAADSVAYNADFSSDTSFALKASNAAFFANASADLVRSRIPFTVFLEAAKKYVEKRA